MSDVLVLNADMLPLTVLPLSTNSWQEAVKAMWAGTVTVIAEYENWIVRSPSIELNVPSIIMVRDYIHVKKDIKFSRYNVKLRDDFVCQYCGEDFTGRDDLLTYEHVTPRYHGGKTNWENIVSACGPCNHKKGHSLNFKKPRVPAAKPDYWKLAARARSKGITVPHASWVEYMSWEGDVTIRDIGHRITSMER